MEPLATALATRAPAPRAANAVMGTTSALTLAMGSRVANIMLTAQVQLAYACAIESRDRALRSGACIARSWPDSAVRTLVVDAYAAQARAAERLAGTVLDSARQRCGLAFAPLRLA